MLYLEIAKDQWFQVDGKYSIKEEPGQKERNFTLVIQTKNPGLFDLKNTIMGHNFKYTNENIDLRFYGTCVTFSIVSQESVDEIIYICLVRMLKSPILSIV